MKYEHVHDLVRDLAKANGLELGLVELGLGMGPGWVGTEADVRTALKGVYTAFFKGLPCARRRPPTLPKGWYTVKGSRSCSYSLLHARSPRATLYAHRVVRTLKGDLQNGVMVLHTCHDGRCLRLRHLKLGGAKQNAVDRRGRQRCRPRPRCARCKAFLARPRKDAAGGGEPVYSASESDTEGAGKLPSCTRCAGT